VLGLRLLECAQLVNSVSGATAEQIFGPVDAAKFCSCMTLFAAVAPEHREFTGALPKYYGGAADSATLERI
jgi:uncharacterized protein (DUF1810 family)